MADAPAEQVTVSIPTNPTLNLRFWEVFTIFVDAKGEYTIKNTNQLVAGEPAAPAASTTAASTTATGSTPAAKKPRADGGGGVDGGQGGGGSDFGGDGGRHFVAERIENGKAIEIDEPPALRELEKLHSRPQDWPTGVEYTITIKPYPGSVSAPKEASEFKYRATCEAGRFMQRNVTPGRGGRVLELKLRVE